MAAFPRGLRSYAARSELMCQRCLQFSTTSAVQSGHNRWSKIKHDKGSADMKRSKGNGLLSLEIAFVSKMGGPDPNLNSRLALVLEKAKKAGVPKALMEAAIARGQGRSSTGAALEYIMLESVMPKKNSNIAVIIEAETDNSKRTLGELRLIVKESDGVVGPTTYLFQKKGRVVFEKDERNLGVDEVLEDAIEAGAEDVEVDEDGAIVLWTEPSKTTSAGEALQKSLGLKVQTSDIIWDPNEDTKVPLDDAEVVQELTEFLDLVRENQNVQGVYANVAQGTLSEEAWEDFQSRLDS
ncbi:hypothetical protein G7Y89_g11617 [Cudoniella acicularis]|uniref:Uncharacterized protein n=1 Tax=Cudoniella acicularis TaxID=354080 RepID=A0A8H4RCS8_9HELO|nr:hypothetical protein G7Y89_g11617 [Cudoniella acicularis]